MPATHKLPPRVVDIHRVERRWDNLDLVEFHSYRYRHLRAQFDYINRDDKARYFMWQSYLMKEMAESLAEMELYPDIMRRTCQDILKDNLYKYIKSRKDALEVERKGENELNIKLCRST